MIIRGADLYLCISDLGYLLIDYLNTLNDIIRYLDFIIFLTQRLLGRGEIRGAGGSQIWRFDYRWWVLLILLLRLRRDLCSSNLIINIVPLVSERYRLFLNQWYNFFRNFYFWKILNLIISLVLSRIFLSSKLVIWCRLIGPGRAAIYLILFETEGGRGNFLSLI